VRDERVRRFFEVEGGGFFWVEEFISALVGEDINIAKMTKNTTFCPLFI
jgi:hypothetical protein